MFFAYSLVPRLEDPSFTETFQQVLPDGVLSNDSEIAIVKNCLSSYFCIALNKNGFYELVYKTTSGDVQFMKLSKSSASVSILGCIILKIDAFFYKEKFNGNLTRDKKRRKAVMNVSLNKLCCDGYQNVFLTRYDKTKYMPASVYHPSTLSPILSTWKMPHYFFPSTDGSRNHNHNCCPYFKDYLNNVSFIEDIALNPLSVHNYPEHLRPIRVFFELLFGLCQKNKCIFVYVYNWFAYVMYSGKKTCVALFFYSLEQGVGKSMLMEIMKNFINVTNVPFSNMINSRFNGQFFETQIVLIEEVNVSGVNENKAQTKAFSENMKNLITNKEFSIEKKFQHGEIFENCVNVVYTSNHIPESVIELGDRRHVIMECDPHRQGDSRFFDMLLKYFSDSNDISNNHEFQENNTVSLDFYSTDECLGCKNPPPQRNIHMAMLSLVFLHLYENQVKNNWKPEKHLPFTKIHYKYQMNAFPEISFISNFYRRKSNNYYLVKTEPWFCSASCTLTREEHFDQEIEDEKWQIHHLMLDISEDWQKIKKQPKNKASLEMLLQSVNITTETSAFNNFYSFPTYRELEKWFRKQLFLDNRTLTFEWSDVD